MTLYVMKRYYSFEKKKKDYWENSICLRCFLKFVKKKDTPT